MKFAFSFFCLTLLSLNLSAQLFFTDADDLADAVNASSDGGVFIVRNGTYNDFEAAFENVATADNPIIVRAETVGGVTLTGESHFVIKKSAYVTLEGFTFDGRGEDSLVKLEGCNNIRISRNVFELETSESIKWVFIGGVFNDNTRPFVYPSHHNRIDHNLFRNKETPGHYITVDGSFEEIEQFDNNFYLQQDNQILISENGVDYTPFQTFPETIIDIRSSEEHLAITLEASISIFDINGNLIQNVGVIEGFAPRYSTTLVEDDAIYIGTRGSGVANLSLSNLTDVTRLLPNGPLENAHFDVAASAGNVWSVFGDFSVSYNPFPLKTQGISRFREEGGWDFIPSGDLFGVRNLVHIAINPQDPGQLYASSYNGGLIEIIDPDPTIFYDENNSPFVPVPTTTDDVRINGGAFDFEGNFWVTNARSPLGLHRVSPAGQFTAFNTEDILAGVGANLDAVAIGNDGSVFVGTDTRGVIAFNPGTSAFARLAGEDGAGNLPVDDVRSLAIDNNGTLWIGTRLGLRVLFGPSQIFENPQISSSEIIIEEDGLAQELLNDQVVTDIIVDGANNKWLATADAGAFYVSSNGQETIFHFTTDNSPLPSNTVQSIAIDPQTGNVFFGTLLGMVSFNGSSTAPADNLEEVIVFPNPVRPGFNGNVRIDGLTANTNVKITDLVGNLVYEENTTGGTIEWDTTAFGRHKVASGVYLILITGPPQGEQETKVEKVMIIR